MEVSGEIRCFHGLELPSARGETFSPPRCIAVILLTEFQGKLEPCAHPTPDTKLAINKRADLLVSGHWESRDSIRNGGWRRKNGGFNHYKASSVSTSLAGRSSEARRRGETLTPSVGLFLGIGSE